MQFALHQVNLRGEEYKLQNKVQHISRAISLNMKTYHIKRTLYSLVKFTVNHVKSHERLDVSLIFLHCNIEKLSVQIRSCAILKLRIDCVAKGSLKKTTQSDSLKTHSVNVCM